MDVVYLAQVDASRWQPRGEHIDAAALHELAQSIRDNGLLNPVIVFKTFGGRYELVAGERRTRACVALALAREFTNHTLEDWTARLATVGLKGLGYEERQGLSTEAIPARVERGESEADLQRLHVMAVIENLDRADLSPIEEARAYKGLMDAYDWRQREMAGHVNRSQAHVAQRLGLLEMAPEVQQAVESGVLPATSARSIARMPVGLQATVAAWAEGKPTRVVDETTARMSAICDPDRWVPNPSQDYTDGQVNRMALVEHVVRSRGWTDTKALGSLLVDSYLSRMGVQEIAEHDHLTEDFLRLIGVKMDWAAFARANGRTCASCIWARGCEWIREGTETCQHWLGQEGPLLSVGWLSFEDNRLGEMEKAGIHVVKLPKSGEYYGVRTISEYHAAMAFLKAAERERQAQIVARASEVETGALAAFQTYMAAARSQSGYTASHQVHDCERCSLWRPGETPACDYARNQAGRHLRFWLLVRKQDGLTVPHCAGWSPTSRPTLHPSATVSHSNDELQRWLEHIAQDWSENSWNGVLHLQWLLSRRSQSRSGFVKDVLEQLATLPEETYWTVIEALWYETKFALTNLTENGGQLLDHGTGAVERWTAIRFEDREARYNYPKGWPTPFAPSET